MTNGELLDLLSAYPSTMEVCMDVDDGVKGLYKAIKEVRIVKPAAGNVFIAIDADWKEESKRFKIH